MDEFEFLNSLPDELITFDNVCGPMEMEFLNDAQTYNYNGNYGTNFDPGNVFKNWEMQVYPIYTTNNEQKTPDAFCPKLENVEPLMAYSYNDNQENLRQYQYIPTTNEYVTNDAKQWNSYVNNADRDYRTNTKRNTTKFEENEEDSEGGGEEESEEEGSDEEGSDEEKEEDGDEEGEDEDEGEEDEDDEEGEEDDDEETDDDDFEEIEEINNPPSSDDIPDYRQVLTIQAEDTNNNKGITIHGFIKNPSGDRINIYHRTEVCSAQGQNNSFPQQPQDHPQVKTLTNGNYGITTSTPKFQNDHKHKKHKLKKSKKVGKKSKQQYSPCSQCCNRHRHANRNGDNLSSPESLALKSCSDTDSEHVSERSSSSSSSSSTQGSLYSSNYCQPNFQESGEYYPSTIASNSVINQTQENLKFNMPLSQNLQENKMITIPVLQNQDVSGNNFYVVASPSASNIYATFSNNEFNELSTMPNYNSVRNCFNEEEEDMEALELKQDLVLEEINDMFRSVITPEVNVEHQIAMKKALDLLQDAFKIDDDAELGNPFQCIRGEGSRVQSSSGSEQSTQLSSQSEEYYVAF